MSTAEQRAALAASLATVGPTVHSVPYDDTPPPCIIIGYPSFEVSSGRVLTATWPISLLIARGAEDAIAADFDSLVEDMLRILTKGVGINFVVQSAAPRPSTPEFPITIPEYVIIGTTTIPLC